MSNTQKFGQTKDPKESTSEIKYKKWSVHSYKHAYRRAEVNRKEIRHKMAQHLEYPKEIPHLKGTAARIEFCDNKYNVTYSSPSTSE